MGICFHLSFEDNNYTSLWFARICYDGTEQESFFKSLALPSEILDTTWRAFCLVELIERFGLQSRIADLAPVGMVHLFEKQHDSSRLIKK